MRVLQPLEACLEAPPVTGIYEIGFVAEVIGRESITVMEKPTVRSCGDERTNALMLVARDREKMLEGAMWMLLLLIPALITIGLCWNGLPRKWSRRW